MGRILGRWAALVTTFGLLATVTALAFGMVTGRKMLAKRLPNPLSNSARAKCTLATMARFTLDPFPPPRVLTRRGAYEVRTMKAYEVRLTFWVERGTEVEQFDTLEQARNWTARRKRQLASEGFETSAKYLKTEITKLNPEAHA